MTADVSEMLFSGIARTTLCTSLAALVAIAFLRMFAIRSPQIHRAAWVLVILQGWMLIPVTFEVAEQGPAPTEQAPQLAASNRGTPFSEQEAVQPQMIRETILWNTGKQLVAAIWISGAFIVLGISLWRYHLLTMRIPLGDASESEAWDEEWREVVADSLTVKKKVHFRVTSQTGPLLCFVPFVYLVLVPRLLWSKLHREDRLAILRHELAHLQHGDLWKNVLIRLLALPQWFNPLAWLAANRFEEAGEWACDEAVVASSDAANTQYASTLLHVARFSNEVPCGAVAVTGGKLTRRVTRLLASSNKEVFQMRDFAVLLLLLVIAVGQTIRIESVYAAKPTNPTTSKATAATALTRAELVAQWRSEPYRVEPPDVLQINLPQAHGTPANGLQESTESMRRNLKCLVSPDGRVSLGTYGSIYVAGMTTEEIQAAVEQKLSLKIKNPNVVVNVLVSNSKALYVVKKGGTLGDNVTRLSLAGNETVLDAIAFTGGISPASSPKLWIAYSNPNGSGPERILPIHWKDLTSGKSASTNYPLIPGDRLFISVENTGNKKGTAASPAAPPVLPVSVYSASSITFKATPAKSAPSDSPSESTAK